MRNTRNLAIALDSLLRGMPRQVTLDNPEHAKLVERLADALAIPDQSKDSNNNLAGMEGGGREGRGQGWVGLQGRGGQGAGRPYHTYNTKQ